MAASLLAANILFHGVLPGALCIGGLLRVDLLSFAYLLLLLLWPHFSASHCLKLPVSSKRLVWAALIVGFTNGFLLLAFHTSLLAMPPYGVLLANCSDSQMALSQIGFHRLDQVGVLQLLRLLVPEVVVCSSAFCCYRKLLSRASARPHVSSALLHSISCNPIVQSVHQAFDASTSKQDIQDVLQFLSAAEGISVSWRRVAELTALGFLLAVSGCSSPSLLSLPYFIGFCVMLSWWAHRNSFDSLCFFVLQVTASVYAACHLLLLYLYQFAFVFESLSEFAFTARLLGLAKLYCGSGCDAPFHLAVCVHTPWSSFLAAFFVFLCYYTLAVQLRWRRESMLLRNVLKLPASESILAEMRNYLEKCALAASCDFLLCSRSDAQCAKDDRKTVKKPARESVCVSLEKSAKNFSSYLSAAQNQTQSDSTASARKPPLAQPEIDFEFSSEERLNDAAREANSSQLKSDGGEQEALEAFASHPRFQLNDASAAPSLRSARLSFLGSADAATSKLIERLKKKLREIERSKVVLGGAEYMARQSYILSLVTMMTWSITYHSWLSFVLLIAACVCWMMPDSRRFTLRLSPFLLVYAQLLLLLQYIYGLQLSQSELPDRNPLILKQIGFEKPPAGLAACLPLLVKIIFALVFCITCREAVREKQLRSGGGIAKKFAELTKFHLVLVAPPSGIGATDLLFEEEEAVNGESSRIVQLCLQLWNQLAHFWIFICALVLLLIALAEPVTAYRLIYMAFFLEFALCFQMSLFWWRRGLRWYYLLMIAYCMLVLSFIYTYQFHGFPEIWKAHVGLSQDALESLGLEVYSPAELFVKLLGPIGFLCIMIVQINFFHHRLMQFTAAVQLIRPSMGVSDNKFEWSEADFNDNNHCFPTSSNMGAFGSDAKKSLANIWEKINRLHDVDWLKTSERCWQSMRGCFAAINAVAWRLLEIHVSKLVVAVMMAISVTRVSALNFPYVVFVALSLPLDWLHLFLCGLASLWTGFVVITKMLYQMKFVRQDALLVNCSQQQHGQHGLVNATSWAGLEKVVGLGSYLQLYLALLALLCLQSLVFIRKAYRMQKLAIAAPIYGVLFAHINRKNADDGLLQCLLYLANYGFFKFGLEMCYVMSVAVMGVRVDLVAVLYGVALMALMHASRQRQARWWPFYVAMLAVLLPLQYLLCVGVPPTLCAEYPWHDADINLVEWLFLPDARNPPNSFKLLADFFQLLFACCQLRVFQIERCAHASTYPGGINKELEESQQKVVEEAAPESENPSWKVHDFITYTKTHLDMLKVLVFMYFHWVSLAMVFITGVSRVTLFAMGYLLTSLVFLWHGNELYLKGVPLTLKLWNILIAYNVIVIFVKTSLQVVGCVYLHQLYKNYCWILQLFGIACMKTGVKSREALPQSVLAECQVPTEEAGILFDSICFVFLLIQKRIVASDYFKHVIAEFVAQKMLASRGAELITKLQHRDIKEQQMRQKEILLKIKRKTDHIKQSASMQRKISQFSDLGGTSDDASKDGDEASGTKQKAKVSQLFAEKRHVAISPQLERIPWRQQRVDAEDQQSASAALPAQHNSDECLRCSVDQFQIDSNSQHPPLPLKSSLRRQEFANQSQSLPSLASHHSSLHDYEIDEDNVEDEVEEADEFPSPESIDVEDDRRKGLGPLQLLNAAFKKGAIKKAVKDAKDAELEERMLEQQMAAGMLGSLSRKKALKQLREIRAQKDMKKLADFEEETFDDEHILTDVVGQDYQRKFATTALPPLRLSQHDLSRNSFDERGGGSSSSFEQLRKIVTQFDGANTQPEGSKRNILRNVLDRAQDAAIFVHLFFRGVLESLVTWLLKISRDYRYVSYVLAEEKRVKKSSLVTEFNRKCSDSSSFSGLHSFDRHSLASDCEAVRKISGVSLLSTHSSSLPEESQNFGAHRSVWVRLFLATYYVLISRSELFCYLMMVLNHMASGSVLSMVQPLLAFLWGTLSVPRPTRLFWVTVITYTQAAVIVKYLFQFGFFPWNKQIPSTKPLWAPRILGIEKRNKYAGWDLALLMALFFHRSILKSLGLWRSDLANKSSSLWSPKLSWRKAVSVDLSPKSPDLYKTSNVRKESRALEKIAETEDADEPETIEQSISELRQLLHRFLAKLRWCWLKIYHFLCRLLPSSPIARCAVDVYVPMFLCDFVCFGIIVFGYWAFGTDQGAGGVASYFQENKVPVPFLVMLIVQFALIIIDRALFLRRFLLGKLLYQLGLVGFVHLWIFFILPAVTDRLFTETLPVKLWYFTKCVYFCLSAWQIRCGYPTHSIGNFLTQTYNLVNMSLFKGFMVIPFLFELRALMDWIWTDTSLPLSDWLTLEDIYANVYLIKCQRTFEEDYPTPRGIKKRPFYKYLSGGAALLLIILIIWFPLVLFSMANRVGMQNLPKECRVQLTVNGYQALYGMRAQMSDLRPLTASTFDSLQQSHRGSKVALTYMQDYAAEDVVEASLNGNSSNTWAITPPERSALIADLLDNRTDVELKFQWWFKRSFFDPFQPDEMTSSHSIHLGVASPVRMQLAAMVQRKQREPILIRGLFPRYVKIPAKGNFAVFAQPMYAERMQSQTELSGLFVQVTLKLEWEGGHEWWRVYELRESAETPILKMVAFVDKVFPATFNVLTQGAGIIGLYVSLVLVVGKFVRMLVTGSMYRIMFEELPCVDRILQLCKDIFLVRQANEFALEEELYAKLIFLYRSPATLIKWTRKKSDMQD